MRRSEALPAWGCAAAVAIAFFLTWPVAELPFNDDWSYAFTALKLAQSGHITYNGWAMAIIIPQAYWGALAIRLFGFSFTVLRLCGLPCGMAAAAICYLLARRCGLSRNLAVLASMTTSLGPLFLPLATSFMSDVPCLMFMLGSLYAIVRCAESSISAGRYGWLAAACAVGLLGGMDRQTVWIVPVALVPYLMILRRRDVGFVIAAAAAWILVLAGALATIKWFNAQPYALPEAPLTESFGLILREPQRLWQTIVALWLTTAMFALPAMLLAVRVALGGLAGRWKGPRGLMALVTLILAGIFLLHFPRFLELPWLGNMLTPEGVLGRIEILGHRPTALPHWVRYGIGSVVCIVTAIILANWVASLSDPREGIARIRSEFGKRPVAVRCCVIFAVVFTAALLSRADRDWVFDRYTLPLIPLLAIAALLAWEHAPLAARTRWVWSRIALAALAGYSGYAIASTQEVLALARARVEAMHVLQDAGIPARDVDAGIEQMAWTQLEITEYINNPGIRNPAWAYREGEGYTPSVKALFEIEASPDPRASAVLMGSVGYLSLLPPFQREIYIYRAPSNSP